MTGVVQGSTGNGNFRRAGPDFMCVGAQKAGTQWLYDQLQHHSDFWMPPVKELHYFDARQADKARVMYGRATADLEEFNLERVAESDRALEARDLEFLAAFIRMVETGEPKKRARLLKFASSRAVRWLPGYSKVHRHVLWPALKARWRPEFHRYGDLFAHRGPALSGDISPGYSVLPSRAVRRITAAFPGLKVVFVARDPVERLWSAVAMRVRKGRESWPKSTGALKRILLKPNYLHRSLQTQIVARWRAAVPDGDFGLFLFDDLLSDAEPFRREVLAFLGGDPDKPSGCLSPDFNRKAGKSRPLPDEFRAVLGQFLAAELRASAADFGGKAATWPAKYGL